MSHVYEEESAESITLPKAKLEQRNSDNIRIKIFLLFYILLINRPIFSVKYF